MRLIQSNQFKKAYKKLHINQLPEMNNALKDIIANPEIGEKNKVIYPGLECTSLKCSGN